MIDIIYKQYNSTLFISLILIFLLILFSLKYSFYLYLFFIIISNILFYLFDKKNIFYFFFLSIIVINILYLFFYNNIIENYRGRKRQQRENRRGRRYRATARAARRAPVVAARRAPVVAARRAPVVAERRNTMPRDDGIAISSEVVTNKNYPKKTIEPYCNGLISELENKYDRLINIVKKGSEKELRKYYNLFYHHDRGSKITSETLGIRTPQIKKLLEAYARQAKYKRQETVPIINIEQMKLNTIKELENSKKLNVERFKKYCINSNENNLKRLKKDLQINLEYLNRIYP